MFRDLQAGQRSEVRAECLGRRLHVIVTAEGQFLCHKRRRQFDLQLGFGVDGKLTLLDVKQTGNTYRAGVPDAEVVLLHTGHFALEEEADTIAAAVDAFLTKHSTRQIPHSALLPGGPPGRGAGHEPIQHHPGDQHDHHRIHRCQHRVCAVEAFYAALADGDLPTALTRLGDSVV